MRVCVRALQLFQREVHPSVYKAGVGNSGKEGLSLYGELEPLSRESWCRKPLSDVCWTALPS